MNKKDAILYTVRFFIISVLSLAIVLLLGIAFTRLTDGRTASLPLPTSTQNDKITLVIDAGHGGEDAGAIAPDGTLEKDLNLEIASLVCAISVLNGIDVKMTRTTDTLLYDYYGDLEDYTGQKKIYDLKNRLKIAEGEKNPVYLGIHMNKFSSAKYSGAQIYYSKNTKESQLLASNLAAKIKCFLQPTNNRQIKAADSSIYILNKIECPAVLVECGFLSNESELECLKNEEYRAKLALTIFSSVCEL